MPQKHWRSRFLRLGWYELRSHTVPQYHLPTANNQLFADQQLDMGEKQIVLTEKQADVVTQQMDVVTGITDPLEKATHYKKVFGSCCDVPQSCCGGGCGCDCASHTDTPVTP